jgi:hypothetical protein
MIMIEENNINKVSWDIFLIPLIHLHKFQRLKMHENRIKVNKKLKSKTSINCKSIDKM